MSSSSIQGNQTDAIENEFDAFVINEVILDIPNRGGTFNFPISAKIPTERHLFDTDEICTLDSAGSIDGFLQIFKASTNNIRTVQATMLGSTMADMTVDDFASYTNTASLLQTYQYSGDYRFEPYLDESWGDQRMAAYIDRRGDGLRIWRDLTATPFNISQYNGMSFRYQSGVAGDTNTFRIVIGDGSSEAYMSFSARNTWQWETREFIFAAFSNIAMIDTTNITYMAIEATIIKSSTTVMFDDWVLTGGIISNTTGIKLYDFGTEANPTVLGTQIPQDYDNYRLEVELSPVKTVVSLPVTLGSHELEDTVTVGNYYGMYIEKPDTGTLTLFGSDTQQYISGKSYTISGNVMAEQTASLGFMVMTAVEARLSSLSIKSHEDPGDSKCFIFVTHMLTGATLFLLKQN